MAALLALLVGLTGAPAVANGSDSAGVEASDRTPPRVAYIHGQVSFWRPGGEDWGPAQVNTPLAPGDHLYVAPGGAVELQVGARAFLRASGGQAGAEFGLESLEPDYLQFRVSSGTASFDVREVPPGDIIDVNTPDGVLTLDRAGYYRVDAFPEQTAFVAYRGGPAKLTLEDGWGMSVNPSEQVLIKGSVQRMEISAAPELSDWDRWSLTRTDSLVSAASGQYVSSGVYGLADLDRHGTWRVTPEYGQVWAPAALPPDWAPYSTGRWIWDPYFEWTWVDHAPWGWAPYHHGRWVQVGGYWAWAPGPVVVRPVYAPALVSFLSPVIVTVSRPVAWVALGWGEPCVPWWGRSRFVGRPWWGGWGGPRLAHAHRSRNADIRRAIVSVPAERFGRGPVERNRLERVDVDGLRPVQGALGIQPTAASVVPTAGQAVRPKASERRSIVAVRQPRDVSPDLRAKGLDATSPPAGATPKTKLVTKPTRDVRPELAPPPSAPGTPRLAAPNPRAPSRGARENNVEPSPARDRDPATSPTVERPAVERRLPVATPTSPHVRPEARPGATPPLVPPPRQPEPSRPRMAPLPEVRPPVEPQRPRSAPEPRSVEKPAPTGSPAPPAASPPSVGHRPRTVSPDEPKRPEPGVVPAGERRHPERPKAAPALEQKGAPLAVQHPAARPHPVRPVIPGPVERQRPVVAPGQERENGPRTDRVEPRRDVESRPLRSR